MRGTLLRLLSPACHRPRAMKRADTRMPRQSVLPDELPGHPGPVSVGLPGSPIVGSLPIAMRTSRGSWSGPRPPSAASVRAITRHSGGVRSGPTGVRQVAGMGVAHPSIGPEHGSPRMRGEEATGVVGTGMWAGSPPHTRGRAGGVAGGDRPERITPAYAGKRSATPGVTDSNTDHPRIRGEEAPHQRPGHVHSGSPPHTRGRDARLDLFRGTTRITPAYAGKSVPVARPAMMLTDHPRIRGEEASRTARAPMFWGSPPHTRGRGCGSSLMVSGLGITPAYAGKSTDRRPVRLRVADHPRIRGEESRPAGGREEVAGSPPHTRGRGNRAARTFVQGRITPAYAGKSPRRRPGRRSRTDHPRIRGEEHRVPVCPAGHGGSPPHTRGRVDPVLAEHRRLGITPAYAGKS